MRNGTSRGRNHAGTRGQGATAFPQRESEGKKRSRAFI